MSKNQSDLRQADFDLLVDGSLHGDRYRKLIQQIDATPGAWKQCALTFLEQQALQQEFSDLLQIDRKFAGDMEKRAAECESQTAAGSSSRLSENAADQSVSAVAIDHGGTDGVFKRYGMFLTVAASFLLAFGLGIIANNMIRTEKSPIANVGETGVPTTKVTAPNSVPLMIRDDQGTTKNFNVPIMSVSKNRRDWEQSLTEELPKDIDNLIKQSDLPYELRRNMVPLTDQNGVVYYIPVDKLNFKKDLREYQ
jgi:hypothetical protein